MYKRFNLRQKETYNVPKVPVRPFDCDHEYKRFGFYLNGGSDPTGEHTAFTGNPSFDSPEVISSGVTVDAFADPKTSFFDVVEKMGVDKANNAADIVGNGGHSDE